MDRLRATSRARAAIRSSDGWFPTGDVATIDADGYMQITDRSKDVIKSGGEWISSIDLENIAMAHPRWPMAACIARAAPEVGRAAAAGGGEEARRELTSATSCWRFFEGKIAKWRMPDDVVFVDAIPLGATGKMQKTSCAISSSTIACPALDSQAFVPGATSPVG